MLSDSIVSILIGLVVVNVQDQTRVRAVPSAATMTIRQVDLIHGVCRKHLWPDLWFYAVGNETEWAEAERIVDETRRPGMWKKLRLIPALMACNYGAKFYWFLALATHVIGECDRLSADNVGDTGDCWDKLAVVLQGGSYTMLEVTRSLAHAHSVIGDGTGSDGFRQNLSTIQNFLCTVVLPLGHEHLLQIHNLIHCLLTYLSSVCRPDCPWLNTTALANDRQRLFPGVSTYQYYIHIMKSYMDDVSSHLLHLGFRYDINTGQTTHAFV